MFHLEGRHPLDAVFANTFIMLFPMKMEHSADSDTSERLAEPGFVNYGISVYNCCVLHIDSTGERRSSDYYAFISTRRRNYWWFRQRAGSSWSSATRLLRYEGSVCCDTGFLRWWPWAVESHEGTYIVSTRVYYGNNCVGYSHHGADSASTVVIPRSTVWTTLWLVRGRREDMGLGVQLCLSQ